MKTVKYNFNKEVSHCRSCGHYNPNSGTFSFCLVQDTDVWEGDYCDKHSTNREAQKWVENEFRFLGTVFDRGDGYANFPEKKDTPL